MTHLQFVVVEQTPTIFFLLFTILLTKIFNTLHCLHYLQHSSILCFCFPFAHSERDKTTYRYYICTLTRLRKILLKHHTWKGQKLQFLEIFRKVEI